MKNIIIAGPCLAESYELLDNVCNKLLNTIDFNKFKYFFKASYKKANRTSLHSPMGVGDITALEWIKDISIKYKVKTLTDVHSVEEVKIASKYVDALQIPAFLSRQTELLLSAGETGKVINIKKAQFMAPDDIIKAAEKVKSTGNTNIFITERGTFFGYKDLVVDFRSLIFLKNYEYPVIYDCTHSVQKPSLTNISGGDRNYIEPLTFAAISTGIQGIFFETHTNPELALSDSATQLPLDTIDNFLNKVTKFFDFRNSL